VNISISILLSNSGADAVVVCAVLCRFLVLICTAAGKEYAYEVWRFLDPTGKLRDIFFHGIFCVKARRGELKSLTKVRPDCAGCSV
jgi:hypothetical protein